MANINYDIATLFERAFGFKRGQPFDEGKIIPPQYMESAPYTDVPKSDETEYSKFRQMRLQLGGNILGQPLFMPVALVIPSANIGTDGELVLLPNEPTLQISVKKTIVKTAMVGSKQNGTIKELVSIDDYDLTIRGICINTGSKRVYPEDEVYKLHALFKENKALEIKSGLTALLGLDMVVIESFDLPSMVGVQHAQAYEFKLISDSNWLLEI